MKKAEYKFNKDRQNQIRLTASETEPDPWTFFNKKATNRPIFIPKRKKKK